MAEDKWEKGQEEEIRANSRRKQKRYLDGGTRRKPSRGSLGKKYKIIHKNRSRRTTLKRQNPSLNVNLIIKILTPSRRWTLSPPISPWTISHRKFPHRRVTPFTINCRIAGSWFWNLAVKIDIESIFLKWVYAEVNLSFKDKLQHKDKAVELS